MTLSAAVYFRGWNMARLVGGVYNNRRFLLDVSFLALLVVILRAVGMGTRLSLLRWVKPTKKWQQALVAGLLFVVVFGVAGTLLTTLAQMHPQRVSCTVTPAAVGVPFDPLTIPAGDVTLSGWHLRATSPKRPVVVVTHGIGSNKQNFLPLGKMVQGLDLDVVLFDFRAHGDSGGHFSTLGLREADDLKAVCAWLKTHHPDRPLYAMGHSMGGAAVIRAAAEAGLFDKIVLDSTFASAENVGRQVMSRFFVPDHAQTAWWHGMRLWGWLLVGVDIGDVRSEDLMGRVTHCPILIIHGTDDSTVAIADARRLHARSTGHATLWEVPGGGHLGNFGHPEYIPRLKRFLTGEPKE